MRPPRRFTSSKRSPCRRGRRERPCTTHTHSRAVRQSMHGWCGERCVWQYAPRYDTALCARCPCHGTHGANRMHAACALAAGAGRPTVPRFQGKRLQPHSPLPHTPAPGKSCRRPRTPHTAGACRAREGLSSGCEQEALRRIMCVHAWRLGKHRAGLLRAPGPATYEVDDMRVAQRRVDVDLAFDLHRCTHTRVIPS